MHLKPLAALALLVAVAFAGCSQTTTTESSQPTPVPVLPTLRGFAPLPLSSRPTFSVPLIIDNVRAGGEPVIAVTQAGTLLVSAHPGFTHYHPSDPTHIPTEILQEYAGQVYLFRSTDGGANWEAVGLAGSRGPRSAGLGVSDPDFTVMADGTICYTDLEALAAASTSCSMDDGETWLTAESPGNAAASGSAVDRQWLASHGDEFYFTANYFRSGPDFRVSTDKGLTWEERGTTPCNGDLVANPANGHIYQSCNGTGITVSTDGGATWSAPRGPKGANAGDSRIMQEPALDAGGNIWTAWTDSEKSLHVAGTPDEGESWPWVYDLTPHFALASGDLDRSIVAEGPLVCEDPEGEVGFAHAKTNGTYVWPWVSAGSAGRLAVTWIGSFDETASDTYEGAWYIFTAYIVNATSSFPTVVVERLTPDPMHIGPICQAGTLCQVSSMQGDPSGDRRLGDFFETTIEPGTGYLLGVWSNTNDYPEDVVGHVQFVRQTGGIPLLSDDDLQSFRPTQG